MIKLTALLIDNKKDMTDKNKEFNPKRIEIADAKDKTNERCKEVVENIEKKSRSVTDYVQCYICNNC